MPCPHELVERRKYTRLWNRLDYRKHSPAETEGVANFISFFKPQNGESLIDFGCGTGRAAKKLSRTLIVEMVDIAANCLDKEVYAALSPALSFRQFPLWAIPADMLPADYIFSCDVLEHIPPEKVDAVLDNMRKLTFKGGYLQICTRPDFYGKKVGEVLHLTVQPLNWWQEKIERRWPILKAHAENDTAYFYIGGKNGSS